MIDEGWTREGSHVHFPECLRLQKWEGGNNMYRGRQPRRYAIRTAMNTSNFLLCIVLLASGCCLFVDSRTTNDNPNMAVVTVLRTTDDKTFETTNIAEVAKLQECLKEVEPTQLPPTQLGNVVPWCTITFFRVEGGTSKPLQTNWIYAIRDRTTAHELLSIEQRQKLLDIFGLEDDFKNAPP